MGKAAAPLFPYPPKLSKISVPRAWRGAIPISDIGTSREVFIAWLNFSNIEILLFCKYKLFLPEMKDPKLKAVGSIPITRSFFFDFGD